MGPQAGARAAGPRREGDPVIEPAPVTLRPAWDGFVTGQAEGDILQSWAWGEAMGGVGERPIRMVARDADGALRGVAQALVRPTSYGRRVLYVPHGPLWDRKAPDAGAIFDALLRGLRSTARAEHGIVVKLDPRGEGGRDSAELRSMLVGHGLRSARFDLQARATRIVDLRAGWPQLMAGWDKDARNLFRRAAREGVTVAVTRDLDRKAIDAFHRLLEETAERGRFRVHATAFLTALAGELAPTGGWYLGLASVGTRPLAGMVAARVGQRAYYLYGASSRDPELRHANGGYATMGAVMEALAHDQVGTLDLWGLADPGDPRADPGWLGFSAFKRRFGGAELVHPGTFDLVVDPLWYAVRDWRERRRAGRSR